MIKTLKWLLFTLFFSLCTYAGPLEDRLQLIVIRGDLEEAKTFLAEFAQKVDFDFQYQATTGKGIEIGNTALLAALSLERLSLAKLILESAPKINVNLKNIYGVSAVHMLAMVEVGDRRYIGPIQRPLLGQFSPSTPIVEPQAIIEIFNLLKDKGADLSDFRTDGASIDQNLIGEAIHHGKPYLAEKIAEAGGPMLKTENTISLQTYLSSGKNAADYMARVNRLLQLFRTHNAAPALIDKLIGPSQIKTFISYFGYFENDDVDKDAKIAAFNQSLKDYLSLNPQLTTRDFAGFLEGVGQSLEDSTKSILLSL